MFPLLAQPCVYVRERETDDRQETERNRETVFLKSLNLCETHRVL